MNPAPGLLQRRLPGNARRRGNSPEERLVQRIRAARREQRLANRSDAELRTIFSHLGSRVAPGDVSIPDGALPAETLALAFAVIDETIRRRLGCWRIFDRPPEPDEAPDLASARRTLAAAGRGRYPGGDLLLPAPFYQAVRRRRDGANGALRFRPTDQQLLAGRQLWDGRIVELPAGEGKTVAAAYPAALHGLLGRTVHIVTANDYLAARDCARLAPVYQALGLTVGMVLDHMAGPERRAAYGQRIVYGTLREFAFDFLRDQLAASPHEQIQGPPDTAIIDEADQTLLDEAVTPLVIAGEPILTRRTIARANRAVRELAAAQAQVAAECRAKLAQSPGAESESKTKSESAVLLARALLAQPDNAETRRLAASRPRLRRRAQALLDTDGSGRPHPRATEGLYCAIDPEQRSFALLPPGVAFLEARLGDFYNTTPDAAAGPGPGAGPGARRMAQRLNLVNQVHQLLRAHLLLRRDVDYIVDAAADRVVLVDRDTGRPRPDSRYQDGLQPAVEAREGVTVHPDCRSRAEISVPGFVRRYRRLAGLTGTAWPARAEFRRLYGLAVAVVPPARPSLRRDLPTRIYARRQDRLDAIVDEVRHCRRSGRPALVAARTVAQSAVISRRLTAAGIPHRLLNAAAGPEEADIVRAAGKPGAVTVATNMAGRGTDIILPPGLDCRIVAGFVDLLQDRLQTGNPTVAVRASTPAEADLLAGALAALPHLDTARRPGRSRHLTVRLRGMAGPPPPAAPPLEFGLGLYVISAEFNESPRVALQLQGRSGRQGGFGATRSLLAQSDPQLPEIQYGPPGADPAGRVCWQGPHLERQLRRRQEAASQDTAAARALLLEYAAVLDAHAANYYRARQETLTATPYRLEQYAAAAAREAAAGLVAQRFPGPSADNYAGRFAALSADLQARYGVNCAPAWGLSLDNLDGNSPDGNSPDENNPDGNGPDADTLGGALANLLRQRLAERRERLGTERFAELARLLLLSAGDELWENHRAGLRAMAAVSRMSGCGPKTAVAEYVIDAAAAWRQFRADAAALFLSRLCLFPMAGLAAVAEDTAVAAGPPAIAIADGRLARLAAAAAPLPAA